MKKLCYLTLLCGSALLAQNNPDAAPVTSVQDVKYLWGLLKYNVLEAAEKMPEAGYAFQPTNGERNFGGWVAHIADTQMMYCSVAAGQPKQLNAGAMMKKADLLAVLKTSFDICEAVYAGTTEANAGRITPNFRGPRPRISVLYANISHTNECYGNMSVYLRLNGIVPPSTELQKAATSNKK